MRFSVAAASLFIASALAVASPEVTVTEVDWVTVTSCPPSVSTNCPVYSHKPTYAVTTMTSTTPCPTTTPTPTEKPVVQYSTYWTYVCPHPEICKASSTVVPVMPSATSSPKPMCPGGYGCPVANVTTPAAPAYTGAASSVNMAAGLAFGLVSFAAVFLA